MQSSARTVEEYLASLPQERRAAIEAVRRVVKANLAPEFEEGMQYGMVGYYLPHSVFPPGYHCDPKQPLPFGGLASQKGHLSLYLMSLYASGPELALFQAQWAKTGKKLDMGKCCIRFKTAEALALDVIAAHLRRLTAKSYIATYVQNLPPSKRPATPVASGRKADAPSTAATRPKANRRKTSASKTATATRPKAAKAAAKPKPARKGAVSKVAAKGSPARRSAAQKPARRRV
jgi:hypothetical protein